MEHTIEVTLNNGLIASKVLNPLTGVASGDTVIWRFEGEAAGQELGIVLQDARLFDDTRLESEAQIDLISRQVSQKVAGGEIFYYDFVKGEDPIAWETSTGMIVIKDPPA